LATGPTRSRVIERPTGDWGPPPPDGEEMSSFDERPVSGRASPYGLDLRVVRDGDEVVAHVTLRAAHEGAPGRSHGGIISALFDDVFGFVLTLRGQPAFTGELTIRYEQGVPLRVPLECRVRMTGHDGRKIHMAGALTGPGDDGEQITFTRARATFIAIDPRLFSASQTPG
ncbi:MAG: PaaI family thioesterase, partial [Ilumatobacteraceae bacterium]